MISALREAPTTPLRPKRYPGRGRRGGPIHVLTCCRSTVLRAPSRHRATVHRHTQARHGARSRRGSPAWRTCGGALLRLRPPGARKREMNETDSFMFGCIRHFAPSSAALYSSYTRFRFVSQTPAPQCDEPTHRLGTTMIDGSTWVLKVCGLKIYVSSAFCAGVRK